jgi:hypothetical chaperone protein
MSTTPAPVCAIDFGTSNSAVAWVAGAAVELVDLEDGTTSMPTAVFYGADGSVRFGNAAIAAYVDGSDGRLMRSIKSILGSDLIGETTAIAPGRSVRYADVVTGYLRHLLERARRHGGTLPTRAVIGRPVYFVDGHAQRDAQAERTLAAAAHDAGLREVVFEYEPIAAALDYESRIEREQLVLVADIGGGTADFSILRAVPGGMSGRSSGSGRAGEAGSSANVGIDRRRDILANHGVHMAGTDFDRAVNLAAIMPQLGFRSLGADGRPVPGSIYFDLATWHLINTTYSHRRLLEVRATQHLYADERAHRRLLQALTHRLGHDLAARAEAAKIEVALNSVARIGLDAVEAGLQVRHDALAQARALEAAIERIVATAVATARLAGIAANAIDAVYFTGGSTALGALTERIGAPFERAERVHGDRFASVVSGLALAAQRAFGTAPDVAAG